MHLVYFLEDLSKKSIKVFPVHISGMHNNNYNEEFIDTCLTTATTTLDIHNFAVLTTTENAQLISNVVGILFMSYSMLTVKINALKRVRESYSVEMIRHEASTKVLYKGFL